MAIPRVTLAAMLIVATAVDAQPRTGFDGSGLYLQSRTSDHARATRLSTRFDIDVVAIVARVSVTQRFVNPSDDWVEGVYVFPLPDDAAVDRLLMRIGNRQIEGEIQEREQAKRTYEAARAAGQQASLVEQERPNLFTTSVANIAPGQEITIEIGYLQTASFDDVRAEDDPDSHHATIDIRTSLVAVDLTPERTRNAMLRREALGNLRPAGSELGAIFANLPVTATDSRWYQLIGVLLAALAIGLIGIWRVVNKP